MANYPTDPAFKTSISPVTSNNLRPALSGRIRGVSLVSNSASRIEVSYPYLTRAQVATLQTFYESNKTQTIVITASDGRVYDAYFESEYSVEDLSGYFVTAKIMLLGNRQ